MTPSSLTELAARVEAGVPADAWDRACRLINFMSEYIGNMAPGKYGDLFADLNAHWFLVERRALAAQQQDRPTEGE